MLGKLSDITTNINVATAENGYIEANFYTEDDGNAYIRITITDNGIPFDFNASDMKPRLDLFCEDTSIFTNEPLDILLPEKGVIQYKVSDNVIKHAGRVDAKLFLSNKTDSIHVANFYFTIRDSGLTGPIGKEVKIDTLMDIVDEVVNTDEFKNEFTEQAKTYVFNNSDRFRINFGDLTEDEKRQLGYNNNLVNYLNVDGNFDLSVFQPIAKNEFNAIRYFKDSDDEFMKACENYVYVLDNKTSTVTVKEDFSTVSKGNVVYNPNNDNPYSDQIGTIIEYKFNGYSISMSALANNTGGIWKASIDGNFIKNISTYGTTNAVNTYLITDSLKNGDHTLTLEFIGQDPDHPTTTPRGWIRTGKYNNTYNTFTVVKQVNDKTYKRLITPGYPISNKEYAISVRDAVTKGTANFFPMHSNVKTSFQGTNYVRELIVDGEDIPLTTVRKGLYFNEAKLIQKVEHRLPEDTEARMECTFIVTFKDGKVYNDIRFKWLKASEVTSGYVFQMPFDNNWFNSVVVDDKEQVNKSTNYGTSSDFDLDNAKIYRGLSNDPVGKDYVYQMTVLETDLPIYRLWLEHRNEYLQKLYPQYYNVTPRNPGDIDEFKGVYEIRKMKDANKVYSV